MRVAEGRSLAEAARLAGFAPASARQRGAELWARPEIQGRVAALSAAREEARTEVVTEAALILDEICDGALQDRLYRVALAAVGMKLRMLGLSAPAREGSRQDDRRGARPAEGAVEDAGSAAASAAPEPMALPDPPTVPGPVVLGAAFLALGEPGVDPGPDPWLPAGRLDPVPAGIAAQAPTEVAREAPAEIVAEARTRLAAELASLRPPAVAQALARADAPPSAPRRRAA